MGGVGDVYFCEMKQRKTLSGFELDSGKLERFKFKVEKDKLIIKSENWFNFESKIDILLF